MQPIFRVLRSRLFQFLAAGGLIFAIAPRAGGDSGTISIPRARLLALRAAEARRLGVERLGVEEEKRLAARAVEDELLYREALRLGLDKSDGVVRQRLIEKAVFLAEELAGATRTPSDAELRAHFEANPGRWTESGSLAFEHVFASSREGAEALKARVEREGPAHLGEAFPLAREVPPSPASAVAAAYGEAFAAALAGAPEGAWTGPLESKFGWHLVRVTDRGAEHPSSFEEARSRVAISLLVERKSRAAADFAASARRRWKVEVDEPGELPEPPPRVALPAPGGGE